MTHKLSPFRAALVYFLGWRHFFTRQGKRFKTELIEGLKTIRQGLATQSDDTFEMLEVYTRWTQGKASDAEMERANRQFRDFLKSLGLGVVIVMPFSPITLPVIVKLGQRLGIDVIPEAFRKKQESAKNDEKTDIC